jgi:hypothetical protein
MLRTAMLTARPGLKNLAIPVHTFAEKPWHRAQDAGLRDIMPCWLLNNYQHFKEIIILWRISIYYESLWRNNSQGLNLQQHHCENLKLYDPEQYCHKNYSTCCFSESMKNKHMHKAYWELSTFSKAMYESSAYLVHTAVFPLKIQGMMLLT